MKGGLGSGLRPAPYFARGTSLFIPSETLATPAFWPLGFPPQFSEPHWAVSDRAVADHIKNLADTINDAATRHHYFAVGPGAPGVLPWK